MAVGWRPAHTHGYDAELAHTSIRAPLALLVATAARGAQLGCITQVPEVCTLAKADAGGLSWQGSYGACSVRKLAPGRDGRRKGESLPSA